MSPNRHIDCLGKHSEAVTYRSKGVVIYSQAKTTFESTLPSVTSFDSKPMKTCIYSLQYMTGNLEFLEIYPLISQCGKGCICFGTWPVSTHLFI